jgi:hypothetical protein
MAVYASVIVVDVLKSYKLGKKRVCAGCSVHYYDLKKSVPICPKCGTTIDLSVFDRAKKHVLGGIGSADLKDIDIELIDGDDIVPEDVDVVDDSFSDDLATLSDDEEEFSA